MSAGILDTCCRINFYASGHARGILKALDLPIYLPEAVRREALYLAAPVPDAVREPIDIIAVARDLDLVMVAPSTAEEVELYVALAAELDDGEAMALAIAAHRDCTILTDERKARRKAAELNVPVLTTVDVLRRWAPGASKQDVEGALRCIEQLARFRPGPRDGEAQQWWTEQTGG